MTRRSPRGAVIDGQEAVSSASHRATGGDIAGPWLGQRVRVRILSALDQFTYKARRGLVKGMVRKGGLGFVPQFLGGGSKETLAEERFLEHLNLEDRVVYDLGAFQGLMTLFFSRRARHVVAYEPNPMCFQRIQEHIMLNDVTNVTVRNVAVADRMSTLRLTYDPLYKACGTADEATEKHLGSWNKNLREIEVEAVSLDEDIAREHLPLPDFVKIDVEGLDIRVLQGMKGCLRQVHPAILIEVHGKGREAKQATLEAIIKLLSDVGYDKFVHVEADGTADPLAGIGTSGVHYYCTKE